MSDMLAMGILPVSYVLWVYSRSGAAAAEIPDEEDEEEERDNASDLQC
jgi:hypothetical protein